METRTRRIVYVQVNKKFLMFVVIASCCSLYDYDL